MYLFPINITISKTKLAIIAIKISISALLSNGIGLITDVNHKIKKTFKILLQTTFQIAISDSFLYAAITEVANSGRLVHIATIVNQITDSLIQSVSAMLTAQETIHCHQSANHISHKTIKNTEVETFIF
ncbi:MAG: hypothetical protein LBQ59_04945 [Candidatus Peribacteria bacterium]|nr:hypothetical protein [Candidatus Peribacteria bacterium]